VKRIPKYFPNRGARNLPSRFLVPGLLLLGIIITFGIAFFFIDPVGFRKTLFQPVREVFFFQRELGAITHWDKIQKVVICEGSEVVIPGGNGFQIFAGLRAPHRENPSPAILLLHGSSPWGRKIGLIRLLALRFEEGGWVVLSPDARGFGRTSDPQDTLTNPEAWAVKNDVRRCIDFLSAHNRTDPHRIYVLGHSMGAGHALEGALEDPRVRGLILIGPPVFNSGAKTSLWIRARFSADRELQQPISEEVMKARILSTDISISAKGGPLKTSNKQILLIAGEREGELNLAFLARVSEESSPPIIYRTLPETDHYCGVYNLFGSDSIYYRPDIFDPFMSMVLEYLGKNEAEKSQKK